MVLGLEDQHVAGVGAQAAEDTDRLETRGLSSLSHHLRDFSTISGLPAVSPGLILKKATYSILRLLFRVIGLTNPTPDKRKLQKGKLPSFKTC
jgi:hypothetical protein